MEGPEDFQRSVSAPTIPEDPNLKSPTLFLYSLAAMCSFWRVALCSNPEFWTLVVLFINFKPRWLIETSLYLKWLRRHHIDASMRTSHNILSGSTRKRQIDTFLRILKSHLRRLFLVPQRPMCFPSPIPSTPIHLRLPSSCLQLQPASVVRFCIVTPFAALYTKNGREGS